MGAGSSTLSKGTTSYGNLIKSTYADKETLERIFMTFLERITPKEMRELYSINQCKKYTFLMAQSLQKFFKATPIGGPEKMIYYVKLEGRAKEEHDKQFYVSCFQVSYFYIHMLQIFCALALTVSSKDSIPYTGGPIQGFPRGFAEIPGLVGGKIDAWDDVAEILGSYLEDSGNGPRFKNQNRLFFYRDTNTLKFKSSSGDKTYIECTIEKTGSQLRLFDFIFNDNGVKKDLRRVIEVDKKDGKYWYYSLVEKVHRSLESRILEVLQNTLKEYEKTGQKEMAVRKDTADIRRIGPERFELRVESLVDRLKGTSNKPYAIARALQLIDPQPIFSGTKQYVSHILDFSYSPIIGNAPFIGSSSQLKEFGATSNNLENVLGLFALEKLYYDNINDISIKDGDKYRINPENEDEYWNFLKVIDCIYKDTSISKDHERKLANKADAIKEGIIMFRIENKEKIAGSKVLNMANPVERRTIGLAQKFQAQLFGYQLQHTKKVMAFIQKYIISVGPTGFKLNPSFFQHGIPYINSVGRAARKMLLQYYVQVEAIYSQGYHVIKTSGASPGPDLTSQCGSFMQ